MRRIWTWVYWMTLVGLLPLSQVTAKSPPALTEIAQLKESLRNEKALNQKALDDSIQFYLQNHPKEKFSPLYLGIADFSKPSSEKRLAIIHIPTGKVDYYRVAHGKGSDKNHDLKFDQFQNLIGSNATPAGFHKMTTTYHGKHGLSLRMIGLEERNKNSPQRAIVLHGAKYVSWKHTGRSQGCPAVENQYSKKIIDQLKGGALFYHFWTQKP